MRVSHAHERGCGREEEEAPITDHICHPATANNTMITSNCILQSEIHIESFTF